MSDENYLDFITSGNRTRRIESWDIENARAELTQLRAELQAAQKRIAQQAAQLEQAREILDNIFKHDWSNSKILTKAQDWLSANAPQPQDQEA